MREGKKNGFQNYFYETLRDVQQGDLVFSYANSHLHRSEEKPSAGEGEVGAAGSRVLPDGLVEIAVT